MNDASALLREHIDWALAQHKLGSETLNI